jgi:hypothetical protein
MGGKEEDEKREREEDLHSLPVLKYATLQY